MLYIILAIDEDDYVNTPDAITYRDLELTQVSFHYNSGASHGYCFYVIGIWGSSSGNWLKCMVEEIPMYLIQ